MLSEKDIGKRIADRHGHRGILRGVDGDAARWPLRIELDPETVYGSLDEWGELDDDAAPSEPAEVAEYRALVSEYLEDEAGEHEGSEWRNCLLWVAGQIRSGEIPGGTAPAKPVDQPMPRVCVQCGAREGDGSEGCLDTMPPQHRWGAPAAREAERERSEGSTVTPEGLRRSAHSVAMAAPAAVAEHVCPLLLACADLIERLTPAEMPQIDEALHVHAEGLRMMIERALREAAPPALAPDRTAAEERADVVALLHEEARGTNETWQAAMRVASQKIERGDHVGAAKRVLGWIDLDAERERRCELNRGAGPDPDARHDDHERGGR